MIPTGADYGRQAGGRRAAGGQGPYSFTAIQSASIPGEITAPPQKLGLMSVMLQRHEYPKRASCPWGGGRDMFVAQVTVGALC